jgi:hypothetical protein
MFVPLISPHIDLARAATAFKRSPCSAHTAHTPPAMLAGAAAASPAARAEEKIG